MCVLQFTDALVEIRFVNDVCRERFRRGVAMALAADDKTWTKEWA